MRIALTEVALPASRGCCWSSDPLRALGLFGADRPGSRRMNGLGKLPVVPDPVAKDGMRVAERAVECAQMNCCASIERKQGPLLQTEVVGPLTHQFTALFKQARPRIGLLNRTADPMPEAQFGDFADLSRVLAPRPERAADSMSRSAAIREHALHCRSGYLEDPPSPVRPRVRSVENADRCCAQWDDLVSIGLRTTSWNRPCSRFHFDLAPVRLENLGPSNRRQSKK